MSLDENELHMNISCKNFESSKTNSRLISFNNASLSKQQQLQKQPENAKANQFVFNIRMLFPLHS
jgi:hypothetical protein